MVQKHNLMGAGTLFPASRQPWNGAVKAAQGKGRPAAAHHGLSCSWARKCGARLAALDACRVGGASAAGGRHRTAGHSAQPPLVDCPVLRSLAEFPGADVDPVPLHGGEISAGSADSTWDLETRIQHPSRFSVQLR